jgi:hypothetical protein
MLSLFRALIDRLKALFATAAAQELEAEFLVRHAEQKADLLRRAAHYDKQGLPALAAELRQQAECFSIRQPLATVLPAIAHLHADHLAETSLLPVPNQAAPARTPSPEQFPGLGTRKKGR